MKVGSKLSIRILIIIIAIFYSWLVYFIFVENLDDLFLKITAVLVGLFYIYKAVQIFSLYIKIEGEYLKVKSIIPVVINANMISTHPRKFTFLISDIQNIFVEYKQENYKKIGEGVQNKYVGKGRAVMIVKTKDGEVDMYLDSFDVKEVETFIQSNFTNK